MNKNIEIKQITTEEMISYFKEDGVTINELEAELIIQFLSVLTAATLEYFLKDGNF